MDFLILGLLVAAIILRRTGQQMVAAVINGGLALLLLFYFVIPGRAGILDWVLLILCAAQAGLFFYQQRAV